MADLLDNQPTTSNPIDGNNPNVSQQKTDITLPETESQYIQLFDRALQDTLKNRDASRTQQYVSPTLLINKMFQEYNTTLGLNGFTFTAQDMASMMTDPVGNIESTKKVMSNFVGRPLSDMDAVKAYLTLYPNEKTAKDLYQVLNDKAYKETYPLIKKKISDSKKESISVAKDIQKNIPEYSDNNAVAKKMIDKAAIKTYSRELSNELKKSKPDEIKKETQRYVDEVTKKMSDFTLDETISDYKRIANKKEISPYVESRQKEQPTKDVEAQTEESAPESGEYERNFKFIPNLDKYETVSPTTKSETQKKEDTQPTKQTQPTQQTKETQPIKDTQVTKETQPIKNIQPIKDTIVKKKQEITPEQKLTDLSKKEGFFDIADALFISIKELGKDSKFAELRFKYLEKLMTAANNIEQYSKNPSALEKQIEQIASKVENPNEISEALNNTISAEKEKQALDNYIKQKTKGLIANFEEYMIHLETFGVKTKKTPRPLLAVTTYQSYTPKQEDIIVEEEIKKNIEQTLPLLINSVALGLKNKYGYKSNSEPLLESLRKVAILKFRRSEIGYVITEDLIKNVKERIDENIKDLVYHHSGNVLRQKKILDLYSIVGKTNEEFLFNYFTNDKFSTVIPSLAEFNEKADTLYKIGSVLQSFGLSFVNDLLAGLTFGNISPLEHVIAKERPFFKIETKTQEEIEGMPLWKRIKTDPYAYSYDSAALLGNIIGFVGAYAIPNMIFKSLNNLNRAVDLLSRAEKIMQASKISNRIRAVNDYLMASAIRAGVLENHVEFQQLVNKYMLGHAKTADQATALVSIYEKARALKDIGTLNRFYKATGNMTLTEALFSPFIPSRFFSTKEALSKSGIFSSYLSNVVSPANIYASLSEAVITAKDNHEKQKKEYYKELIASRYFGSYMDSLSNKRGYAFNLLQKDTIGLGEAGVEESARRFDKITNIAFNADLIYNSMLLMMTNPLGVNNIYAKIVNKTPLVKLFGHINYSNPVKAFTTTVVNNTTRIVPKFMSKRHVIASTLVDYLVETGTEATVESLQELAQDKVGRLIYKNAIMPIYYEKKTDPNIFNIYSHVLRDEELFNIDSDDKYTIALTTTATLITSFLGLGVNSIVHGNKGNLYQYNQSVRKIKDLFEEFNNKGGVLLLTSRGLFVNPRHETAMNALENILRIQMMENKGSNVILNADEESQRQADFYKIQFYNALKEMGLLDMFARDMAVILESNKQKLQTLNTLDEAIEYSLNMSGKVFESEKEKDKAVQDIKKELKTRWYGDVLGLLDDKNVIGEDKVVEKEVNETEKLIEQKLTNLIINKYIKDIENEQRLLTLLTEKNEDIEKQIENIVQSYFGISSRDLELYDGDTDRNVDYNVIESFVDDHVERNISNKTKELFPETKEEQPISKEKVLKQIENVKKAAEEYFKDENDSKNIEEIKEQLRQSAQFSHRTDEELEAYATWFYRLKKLQYTQPTANAQKLIEELIKSNPNNNEYNYILYRFKKSKYKELKENLRNLYYYLSVDLERDVRLASESKEELKSKLSTLDPDLSKVFEETNGDIQAVFTHIISKTKELEKHLNSLTDIKDENSAINRLSDDVVIQIYRTLLKTLKERFHKNAGLLLDFDKIISDLKKAGLSDEFIRKEMSSFLKELEIEEQETEQVEGKLLSENTIKWMRSIVYSFIFDLNKDYYEFNEKDIVVFNTLKSFKDLDINLRNIVEAYQKYIDYISFLENMSHLKDVMLLRSMMRDGIFTINDIRRKLYEKAKGNEKSKIIETLKYDQRFAVIKAFVEAFNPNFGSEIEYYNDKINALIEVLLDFIKDIENSPNFTDVEKRYIRNKIQEILGIIDGKKISILQNIDKFGQMVDLIEEMITDLVHDMSEIQYDGRKVDVFRIKKAILMHLSSLTDDVQSRSVADLINSAMNYIVARNSADENGYVLSMLLDANTWSKLKQNTSSITNAVIGNISQKALPAPSPVLFLPPPDDTKEQEKEQKPQDLMQLPEGKAPEQPSEQDSDKKDTEEQLQDKEEKTTEETQPLKETPPEKPSVSAQKKPATPTAVTKTNREDEKDSDVLLKPTPSEANVPINIHITDEQQQEKDKKTTQEDDTKTQDITVADKGKPKTKTATYEEGDSNLATGESVLFKALQLLEKMLIKDNNGTTVGVDFSNTENYVSAISIQRTISDASLIQKLKDESIDPKNIDMLVEMIKNHYTIKTLGRVDVFIKDLIFVLEIYNKQKDLLPKLELSFSKDFLSKVEKVYETLLSFEKEGIRIDRMDMYKTMLEDIKANVNKVIKDLEIKEKSKPIETKKAKPKKEAAKEDKKEPMPSELPKEEKPKDETDYPVPKGDKPKKASQPEDTNQNKAVSSYKKETLGTSIRDIDNSVIHDKEIKINLNIDTELLDIVFENLNKKGKKALIVGGSVRDALLSKKPKDIDIEVYNSTLDELLSILKQYGFADEVGKSFGIIKFMPWDHYATLLEGTTLPEKGLILPIGISGSGKSTWIDKIKNQRQDVVIVSPDEIRKELTGDISDQSKNKEVWEIAKQRVIDALNADKLVILDATNVNTEERLKFISAVFDKTGRKDLFYKIFESNPKVSKERIKADIQKGKERSKVPDEVIDRQYSLYEKSVSFINKAKALEEPFDFSVPRRESKSGKGHKGFVVEFDKNITIEEAASRRDLTWNSLGYDPVTKTLYNYFDGVYHLKEGIIKHTSDKFVEDPLRIYRIMQFQARTGHKIHPETIALIRDMVSKGMLDELPKQRIFEEFIKWAVKGEHHYLIFDFLRDTGIGEKYFPELMLLKETPQDPVHHPEGDVEIHTKLVLKEAQRIAKEHKLSDDDKLVLIFSALLHDIAKPNTTVETIDKKTGRKKISSPGHEEAGEPIALNILSRIGIPNKYQKLIGPIIRYHLQHVHIHNANEKSKMKILDKVVMGMHIDKTQKPRMDLLFRLIEADNMGRAEASKYPDSLKNMEKLYQEYTERFGHVYTPIVKGDAILKMLEEKGHVLKDKRNMKELMNAIKEKHLKGEIDKDNVMDAVFRLGKSMGFFKKKEEPQEQAIPKEMPKQEEKIEEKQAEITPKESEQPSLKNATGGNMDSIFMKAIDGIKSTITDDTVIVGIDKIVEFLNSGNEEIIADMLTDEDKMSIFVASFDSIADILKEHGTDMRRQNLQSLIEIIKKANISKETKAKSIRKIKQTIEQTC